MNWKEIFREIEVRRRIEFERLKVEWSREEKFKTPAT